MNEPTTFTTDYEVVIGLEIHVELSTESKMFCGCKVDFGGTPNTRVCPVCLGLPGALPVPNRLAVERTVLIGLAVGCGITERSLFARKNYFYPDMPKDYQISQSDLPFCVDGKVDIEVDGKAATVGVTRVHLEEDTGKMVHVGESGRIHGADYSLVDFNRAGTPLVEIVSEPDITSPEHAKAYVQKIRSLLLYLDVSDCNMEEGSMRADANVSLRPKGEIELGTKTEIKNMNSLRGIQRALAYEIQRQDKVLSEGGRITQETRHWDAVGQRTSPTRSKEEAHDYRYFPEPDLLPVVVEESLIDRLRQSLPELPEGKKARFIEQYDVSDYNAEILVSSQAMADYFERAAGKTKDVGSVVRWMTGELLGLLNGEGKGIEDSLISSDGLLGMLDLIEQGTISGKMAKEVFEEMYASGKTAPEIVKDKGLEQISDESVLDEIIAKVIEGNPGVVEDFRGGKDKALGFLVGQVMKETRGSANPGLVNKLLKEKL